MSPCKWYVYTSNVYHMIQGTTQHIVDNKIYLDKHYDGRTCRQALLEDLGPHTCSSQETGNQQVVIMDCNEDVQSTTIIFWLKDLSLTDIVLMKHRNSNSPAMYNRSSKLIGCIFCTSTINVKACGYLTFGNFQWIIGLYWQISLMKVSLVTIFPDVFSSLHKSYNVKTLSPA